jgi:hypothetical protein
MATYSAQERGRKVIASAPIRLARKDAGGEGAWKHQAAVCPASQSDRNVMPANAPDECPEGNDLRPSIISEVCLEETYDFVVPALVRKNYPVHAWMALSHSHLERKSGRRRPSNSTRYEQKTDIEYELFLPTLTFRNTVISRASPL